MNCENFFNWNGKNIKWKYDFYVVIFHLGIVKYIFYTIKSKTLALKEKVIFRVLNHQCKYISQLLVTSHYHVDSLPKDGI